MKGCICNAKWENRDCDRMINTLLSFLPAHNHLHRCGSETLSQAGDTLRVGGQEPGGGVWLSAWPAAHDVRPPQLHGGVLGPGVMQSSCQRHSGSSYWRQWLVGHWIQVKTTSYKILRNQKYFPVFWSEAMVMFTRVEAGTFKELTQEASTLLVTVSASWGTSLTTTRPSRPSSPTTAWLSALWTRRRSYLTTICLVTDKLNLRVEQSVPEPSSTRQYRPGHTGWGSSRWIW